MRIAIVLVLALSSTAAAEQAGMKLVGLGTSIVTGEPGWILRVEGRTDFERRHDDDDGVIAGARIGLETWRTGHHLGFAVPLGWYVGAQVKSVRAALGGGFALWAFDHTEDETFQGLAPFASSTTDLMFGKLVISLDVRLSRQAFGDRPDFNVYSVMLMVGKRREP